MVLSIIYENNDTRYFYIVLNCISNSYEMKQKKKSSTTVPKIILFTAKILETISSKWATNFAIKLFITPLKHPFPKREWKMLEESHREVLLLPKSKKEIVVYQYGEKPKKILLVHGWSGRGTQLVKIADTFKDKDYAIVSFDAPGHGNSKRNKTLMTEFIEAIHYINQIHGPFEYAIGHSLGGMAILNAIKENFKVQKAVTIGSGDVISDIVEDFISKIQMKPEIGDLLQQTFEKKHGFPMNNYSSSIAAKFIKTPVLIIHDTDDEDVPVTAAYNIHNTLENSEIHITNKLGHRKILGDEKVIQKIKEFVEIND